MNNYANRFFLWVFLLPSGLYRRLGADFAHLKVILTTKLTIDDRTATGLYAASSRDKEGGSNLATVFTMFISLVVGLLFMIVFTIDDDLDRMTMYFTLFGVMLAMFLITDFSHILVDAKDNYIILPKPVSSQTFLLARLVHVIIHVSKILVPMTLPAWIGLWITRGLWGAVVFIPVVLLLTILTFTLVNAVYLLIMRFFSPTKINSIITTMQIVFSIVIYGGFHIVSGAIGISFLEEIKLTDSSWIWIFPSFWMAGAWTFIYSLNTAPVFLIGTILSVVIPFLGLWLMIRFLAPIFLRKLSMISTGTEEEKSKKTKPLYVEVDSLSSKIARLFTRPGIERESFLFTWRMTARSRDFKLKVYPQVGYMVILSVVFAVGGNINVFGDGLDLSSARIKMKVLFIIYLSAIMFLSAIFQLAYSSVPKAAWIYFSPPLARPGLVISGAIRACLAKFVLPLAILITVTGVVLFGPEIVPNLLFGFGNVFLACTLISWIAMDKLPFSVSLKIAAEGETVFRNIISGLALPLFGIPHYFLFDFPLVVSMLAVVSITAGYLVLRYTRNISWQYVGGA